LAVRLLCALCALLALCVATSSYGAEPATYVALTG
jgi:hypothetical protein